MRRVHVTPMPLALRRLEGPGSAERLRRLQARFRRVSPAPRRARLDGLQLWLCVWMGCVGVCGAMAWRAADIPDASPSERVRHLLAKPNCQAARLVRLAPSAAGRPGYWAEHDRDRDGAACEPWSPE
jgi:hypothetical protein